MALLPSRPSTGLVLLAASGYRIYCCLSRVTASPKWLSSTGVVVAAQPASDAAAHNRQRGRVRVKVKVFMAALLFEIIDDAGRRRGRIGLGHGAVLRQVVAGRRRHGN